MTHKVTVTLRTRGPLVPRIVSVYFPGGVVALVATLSVVDPDVVTEAGLNVAVAPDGRPVTLNATVPVNPFTGVTVAVYVVLPPGCTVRDVGVLESEKSETVIVRVAGALVSPRLSVTLNVAVFAPGVV